MIPPRTIRILLFLATIFFLIGSNPLPEAVVYAQPQACNTDADCNDFDFCVITCVAGFCQPPIPRDCDNNDACTTDGCSNPQVMCTHQAIDCSDNDVCTVDSCNPATVQCTNTPSDALCDDGNVCTDDSCDPAGSCQFVDNTASCEDGDLCTLNDVCAGGNCQSGSAQDCDDLNLCTDDTCDPSTGNCQNANNSRSLRRWRCVHHWRHLHGWDLPGRRPTQLRRRQHLHRRFV